MVFLLLFKFMIKNVNLKPSHKYKCINIKHKNILKTKAF